MKKIFALMIFCFSIFTLAQQVKVPFVGHRSFDIMEGYSGTGTPHYYLDVKKSGDVHFGYVQINQANGKETKEEINAGQYSPDKVMKVHFKKFNETLLVKFDKNKIYLTDEKGNIKSLEGCCSSSESIDKETCTCESGLYE